jgi:selenocysteine lyase/cysteine desulfurase
MVLPWEKVVDVCHRYGVMSLVDGAHSIGQHKVDVGRSKCDFFVTVRQTSASYIVTDPVELP